MSLNTESGDSLPTIARGPSPSVLRVQSCLELHPRDAGALGSHGLGSPPALLSHWAQVCKCPGLFPP